MAYRIAANPMTLNVIRLLQALSNTTRAVQQLARFQLTSRGPSARADLLHLLLVYTW